MIGPAEIEEMMMELAEMTAGESDRTARVSATRNDGERLYMGEVRAPGLQGRAGTETYVVLTDSGAAAITAMRDVRPNGDIQILALSSASPPVIDRLRLVSGVARLVV